MTVDAAAGTTDSGTASGDGTGRPAIWRRWVDSLYPPAPAARPGRRAILLGVLGFLLAMAASLSRTGGPGALNSIWIEDAKRFLTDALWDPFTETIPRPFNGYFHVGPRVLAETAALFPLRWSAPVLTLLAVAFLALVVTVVYLASGRFFDRWWLRLLVAAPVVVVPLGHTQADNDIATLQFHALYALFWICLWRPVTGLGSVVAVLLATDIAASSILAVTLAPMVLLRLYAVRDWTTRVIGVGYAAGMALQFGGMALGLTSRESIGERNYNPLWLADEYATKAVPRSLLGERWLGGPGTGVTGWPEPLDIASPALHNLLIVTAWLLLLTAVACAVLGLTRPHWPLAVTAALAGAGIFALEVANMGWVQPRYLIPTALLLYTAVVALLRPYGTPRLGRVAVRPAWSALPALALTVLLVVVCAVNLRGENGRSTSQGWDRTVAQAQTACTADAGRKWFTYKHTWWYIRIPCHRVR